MRDMARRNYYYPKKMLARLSEMSAETGASISELLRRAIAQTYHLIDPSECSHRPALIYPREIQEDGSFKDLVDQTYVECTICGCRLAKELLHTSRRKK